jgi:hypothetical protein
MADKQSFTKYEHQVLPGFRERISKAESTEDVKKFFAYVVGELMDKVFDGALSLEYGDVALDPAGKPFFVFSERVRTEPQFSTVSGASDLLNVVGRLAETAVHRYQHLSRHPEKTNSKIRAR